VVLVLIGAAILLHNYGYVHVHLWNILRLWPIFLVIAGINLVFAHNKSPWATGLKIAVVVLGLGLVLFGNFGNRYNFWPGMHYNYNYNDNNDNDNDGMDDSDTSANGTSVKMTGDGVFNEPYKAGAKTARLEITGAATVFNLSDTTNQLFNAKVTGNNNNHYGLWNSMDDSTYVLEFKMKNKHGFNFDSDKNKVDFRLNPNPEWEIHVATGAASLNFDLSKFKVRELKLAGGAASFNVKLGAPLSLTDVDISTGMAGVDIKIPQNAACSIESDSALSDNQFEGFNKTDDNNYETSGFDSAKNKIHIHISGGMSGFHVTRY